MMVLGSHRFYRRYFPQQMREHFEIAFCDLRQWVQAPAGFDISAITLDTITDDVDALREAAGFDRAIVAGPSQHGAIALAYARRVPEHARGVAAITPFPPAGTRDGLEPRDDFFVRDATPERLSVHERNLATRRVPEAVITAQDFMDDYSARAAKAWFDPSFDDAPLWEGVLLNLAVMNQVFSKAVLGGYTIDGLEVPVFLALGRYDYIFPAYWWDQPRTQLRNLCYRLYERSAHQPPYEQPDEFVADLVDWAASL